MSEITKQPCPFCGCTTVDLLRSYATATWSVRCDACHMVGPDSGNEDCAVERWNAMPRRLRWTKEKPTTCDFYWYRSEGGSIEIGIIYEDIMGSLAIHFAGEKHPHEFRFVDGWWAGPIPEPE